MVADALLQRHPEDQVEELPVIIRDGDVEAEFHGPDIESALAPVHHLPHKEIALIVVKKMLLQPGVPEVIDEIAVGFPHQPAVQEEDLIERGVVPWLQVAGHGAPSEVFIGIRPDGLRDPRFHFHIAHVVLHQDDLLPCVVVLGGPDIAVVVGEDPLVDLKIGEDLVGVGYLVHRMWHIEPVADLFGSFRIDRFPEHGDITEGAVAVIYAVGSRKGGVGIDASGERDGRPFPLPGNQEHIVFHDLGRFPDHLVVLLPGGTHVDGLPGVKADHFKTVSGVTDQRIGDDAPDRGEGGELSGKVIAHHVFIPPVADQLFHKGVHAEPADVADQLHVGGDVHLLADLPVTAVLHARTVEEKGDIAATDIAGDEESGQLIDGTGIARWSVVTGFGDLFEDRDFLMLHGEGVVGMADEEEGAVSPGEGVKGLEVVEVEVEWADGGGGPVAVKGVVRGCRLSVVGCLLSVVCCRLSVVRRRLSVVGYRCDP